MLLWPLQGGLQALLLAPIHFYRRCVSPWLPPRCRFRPTCSEYAITAIEVHGAARGLWLALRRLLRCHPFCDAGWDPVPAPPQSRPRSR